MPALPFAVIPVPLGGFTTGNERAEKPAAHLGQFRHIGMTWRSVGNATLWVRCQLNAGSALPIDFVSVLHANATSSTTIRVRLGTSSGDVDGSSAPYDSGAVPFVDPAITRDDGLYSSHLELPSSVTASWIRIDIGSHTGDFEAAKLVVGKKLTPANFYAPNFEFGVEDRGTLEVGRYGVVSEEPGVIFRVLKVKFGWMTEADFETKFRPLDERLGRRGIALWCFDPTANAYRQARTYFGWLKDPPYATGGVNNTRFEKEYQIYSMV